jgi:hypothetical protein
MRRPAVPALLSLATLVLLAAGCGGSDEQPVTPTDEPSSTRPRGPQLNMDADIGALDEGKVRSTFEKQSKKISSCFEKGSSRLPYMAGEIRFHIRVDQSGKAKSVHAIDSSLGDLETEECMISALESASWPAPEGGREGIAESPFSFDPGGSTRPPVDIEPSTLGKEEAKVREVIAGCKSSSGAGRLKTTIYVEADGKVKAVGVSGEDPASRPAAKCVSDGIRELKLPSPGSYAGKVVLTD